MTDDSQSSSDESDVPIAAVVTTECDSADDLEPPPPNAPSRERHWQMLWLSTFVIFASWQLDVVAPQQVAPRLFPAAVVPEMCMSRKWFDAECPGCGLTRSFIYLAQGSLSKSLEMNRFGWVMAFSVVVQIPYRVAALYTCRTILPVRLCKWYGRFLIFGLITNWLVNIVWQL